MVELRNLQSLDRLARAAGSGRYAVVCIAEAVHPVEVDTLLDKLRRLKSEIHGLISTNVSTTRPAVLKPTAIPRRYLIMMTGRKEKCCLILVRF